MKVELTHDVIALKIWEQLPERDKQVRRISHSLDQRFNDYNKGKASLLGAREIDAWEEYFPLLKLTEDQDAYISKSKSELARAAFLKKVFGALLVGLTVLAVASAIMALISRNNLKEKNDDNLMLIKKADILNAKLLQAFKDLAIEGYSDNYEKGIVSYDDIDFGDAMERMREAKTIIASYVEEMNADNITSSFVGAQRDSFLLSTERFSSPLIMQVDSMIERIQIDSVKKPIYQDLLERAEHAEEARDYIVAFNLYKKANEELATDFAKGKMNEVREVGARFYFDKGRSHIESNTKADYQLAIMALDRSMILKSADQARRLKREVVQLLKSL